MKKYYLVEEVKNHGKTMGVIPCTSKERNENIRERAKRGESLRFIGLLYGITPNYVKSIVADLPRAVTKKTETESPEARFRRLERASEYNRERRKRGKP